MFICTDKPMKYQLTKQMTKWWWDKYENPGLGQDVHMYWQANEISTDKTNDKMVLRMGRDKRSGFRASLV